MSSKEVESKGERVRELVREGYAGVARNENTVCGPSRCCGSGSPDDLAQTVGYSSTELDRLPEGANLGLSCGNPTALASLRPGEVVLDLGSGAGFDVFIAAEKVGASGRVIGVDMTPEMLDRARRNVAAYKQRSGLENVEFRLGEIEHLPLADASVDVVLSNCVVNLSPDKSAVWREVARVLRPGGRVAISDLALLQPLPEQIRTMLTALLGCVAGAVPVAETERLARNAGLAEVHTECQSDYVETLTHWEDPLYRKMMEHLPEGARPSDYVTSAYVTARKPAVV